MNLARLLRQLLPWVLIFLVTYLVWKQFRHIFTVPEPKITVSHNTVLTKIEAMGKLELVRYNFKDVVEYKKEIMFFPDSRSVLIVAGEAVGCIDLRKLKENDLVFTGDSLMTVYLPKPEICYTKVDHSKSKILLMENTYFRDAELVEEAYKYAEKNVLRSAQQSGILRQTEQNAEKILKPMLETFSGRKVILRRQDDKLRVPQVPKN
ncbi:MAG TPA: DUF4230 domain-containing protein [Adhaeribacter sp.]|nr:DUF4230 domain-containing protein [Adhaeribacter sp.]